MNKQQHALFLALVATCCLSQALASPFATNNQQDQEDEEVTMLENGANRRQQQDDGDLNDFGGSFKSPGYGVSSDSLDQQQQQPQQLEAQNFHQQRPGQASHHQALASENSENQADDDDEGSDSDEDSAGSPTESLQIESGSGGGMGSRRGAMALARALAESSSSNNELQQPWLEGSGSHNNHHHQAATDNSELGTGVEEAEIETNSPLFGADSNIANAKIELSPQDKVTAAGHHHHHGHYVHGWLKMGAETGKKGAFKWHDKHPVGGKGRR